jgi:hypothetical protein
MISASLARALEPPVQRDVAVPISGDGFCLTFAGMFSLQMFVATSRGMTAVGALTGTMTNTSGDIVFVVRKITLPVTICLATHDIVRLNLGPVSLDLLGLQLTLSRISLDIRPAMPLVGLN